MDYYSYLYWQ